MNDEHESQKSRQYHEELFQQMVGDLLTRQFPGIKLRREVMIRRKTEQGHTPIRFDFGFVWRGKLSLVETKVLSSTSDVLKQRVSIRLLAKQLENLDPEVAIGDFILALSFNISNSFQRDVEVIKKAARERDISFQLWDATFFKQQISQSFNVSLIDLGLDSLSSLLRPASSTGASSLLTGKPELNTSEMAASILNGKPEDNLDAARNGDQGRDKVLKEGLYSDVVVLMADFCSYSRFVNASGGDRSVISAIMGRFYREARQAVTRFDGILDKFMGDGLLAFWLPPVDIRKFEECLAELVGLSLKLAESWQEKLDHAISPTGMRCGAALGEVLFIQETYSSDSVVHAIGESINLAARLQTAAKPNCVVTSNKLRQRYPSNLEGLTELEPVEAKNLGMLKAWEKDLTSKPPPLVL